MRFRNPKKERLRQRFASLAVTTLALVSCSADPDTLLQNAAVGQFVEGPCPMPVPDGLIEGESVKCGTVSVPEFHTRHDGRSLTLAVAVFPSIAEEPSPSPLFVATAGPGASGIESITPLMAGQLGPAILSQRDLVLIDYRGLPLAEPNLICPEITDWAANTRDRDLAGEGYMAGQLEAAVACRDRLRGEGIALDAFNNAETAADVVMVITALGYDTFNVYGTSAGTILAQQLMRDFPDRLRSVLIDSIVPAGRGNVHVEAAAIAARSLEEIVSLCESDSDCAAAYPELRQEASGLIRQFERDPLMLEGTHSQKSGPADLLLNGHRVAQSLLMLNSQTPTVPLVPGYVHQLASRNVDGLGDFLWTLDAPSRFSWALGTSIFCMEYSDFAEEDILYPGIFPEYESAIATQSFGARTIARTCEIWGVDTSGASVRQPVESDVPTLLMAGQLDNLTPPAWAEEVARGLSNGYLFEIQGYAHSPTFAGECPASMGLQFLSDPSGPPDSSCLESMEPRFLVEE